VFKSTKQKDRKNAWEVCLGWVKVADLARQGVLTEVQARRVVSEILERTSGEPLNSASTQDFLTQWIASKKVSKAKGTAVRYEGVLENFLKHLGTKRAKLNLTAITPADIQSFRDAEIATGKAESTANFSLKTLRSVFGAARRQGLLTHNPAEAVDALAAEQERREAFSLQQLKELLRVTAGTEWEGMILLGFCTGARLGDCAAMAWSNVDLNHRLLRYVPGKTNRGKGRKGLEVPLLPDLEKYLLHQAAVDSPQGNLFPQLAKKTVTGNTGLSNTFSRLMAEAGIESGRGEEKHGKGRQFCKLGFHSLRHTCNSMMANAGVTVELRREILGHASDAMNARYTHHDQTRLRTAINALPSVRDRTPKQLGK
jgi:integrase